MHKLAGLDAAPVGTIAPAFLGGGGGGGDGGGGGGGDATGGGGSGGGGGGGSATVIPPTGGISNGVGTSGAGMPTDTDGLKPYSPIPAAI